MWSVKLKVWGVRCKVYSRGALRSVQCGVWSVKCKVPKCVKYAVKCGLRSVKCTV